MKQLDVFDPPMCCSTGLCGEDVDARLVSFAADLEWLKGQGVTVKRYNLSQDPQAFMNQPAVLKAVSFEGTKCLPLLVRDEKVISRGSYPSRDELAVLAGVAARPNTSKQEPVATSCCGPVTGHKSGCCSR